MSPVTKVRAVGLAVLLALAPAAAGSCAPAAPDAAGPPPGRPLVLVLHGRGHDVADTAALRHRWAEALQDGVVAATGESLLREGDLRLVWYAEALRDLDAPPCAVPARAEGGRAGADGDAGEAGDADRADDPARGLGEAFEAAGTLMALAATWLGPEEGRALRSLAGDLRWLGDEDRRCAAEASLADALAQARAEGRPVVLVAHSFGALVGYHHLRTRAGGPPVERLITVGALLGHPELRELLFREGAGAGLPEGVGSWVNVHDPRDVLSAPLAGEGVRDGEEEGRVRDRRTAERAEGDPHALERYLEDPEVVEAVLETWCGLPGGEDAWACRRRESGPGGVTRSPSGGR